MPNRNHMGPLGDGPRTGRGLGTCNGNAERAEPRVWGGGMGRGRCHGRGNGWGGGRGNGRGNGWGFPNWFSDVGQRMQAGLPRRAKDEQSAPTDSAADRQDLMRQAEWLREQLQQVEQRLNAAKNE